MKQLCPLICAFCHFWWDLVILSRCEKQPPHPNTKTRWILWCFSRLWWNAAKCKMKQPFQWFTLKFPVVLPLNVLHHLTLSVLRSSAWPCTSFWLPVKWERIGASERIGNNTTLGLGDDWWANVEPRAWTQIHILAFPLKLWHTLAVWVSKAADKLANISWD